MPDWTTKHRQLIEDGFCVIEDHLDEPTVKRLRCVAASKLEKPEADRTEQKSTGSMIPNRYLPELADLIASQQTLDALARLGFTDVRFSRAYLISKPPHSPQLFWHQDFTVWSGEPRAYSGPSPQIFAMFYLVDTVRHNGCLRFLPGSHHSRHPLHDELDVAHAAAARRMDDPDSPLYGRGDGEVDVPVCAGDLVLGDGRALHAAHPNQSNAERSVITIWYHPMFSDLQEGSQKQIADLAQAEWADWPDAERGKVAKIIASYEGAAEATPRDRVPGEQLRGQARSEAGPEG